LPEIPLNRGIAIQKLGSSAANNDPLSARFSRWGARFGADKKCFVDGVFCQARANPAPMDPVQRRKDPPLLQQKTAHVCLNK
jgi:hypothetical protein